MTEGAGVDVNVDVGAAVVVVVVEDVVVVVGDDGIAGTNGGKGLTRVIHRGNAENPSMYAMVVAIERFEKERGGRWDKEKMEEELS